MRITRRLAREAALRALYEIDLGKSKPAEALAWSIEELELEGAQARYAERLVLGICQSRRELDQTIAKFVQGYDYDRLVEVDRNILRIAAYELLNVPEIAPAVTIDEAVEIAKRYSTSESGRFVNGVLGALVRQTPKAVWDSSTAPEEVEEEALPTPEPEVEEIEVGPEDEAFKAARRVGGWKLGERA